MPASQIRISIRERMVDFIFDRRQRKGLRVEEAAARNMTEKAWGWLL
jgi:hypothetical protein